MELRLAECCRLNLLAPGDAETSVISRRICWNRQGVDGMPTERSEAVAFRQNRSEVESDGFFTQKVESSRFQGISAHREGRCWWR